jgi:transcriptional regulator with GAF, ATPase, and Fis domain
MLETGYRQLIAGPLMKGGEAFGMVCFNAKQPDFYSAQDLPLFQAIAEQLAVVVANILANEEILEREREKTQLLKVSEAISTIRDAKSLFSSLSDIIQSIIAFDEAPMIFLLDEQSQYYRIFYSKVFDPSANLSSLDAWQQGENLVATDAIATYLIEQNHALVLNLQQALEQWRDFPGKQTMLDLALKECLVAPLRVKDSLTGFLCVWSRKEGKFEIPKLNLFQAIADQVAVAIANILANEEILAREQEKTLLLSISEDIASVRGKKDLLNVVVQKIKPLFDFYDCGILILDKDRRSFYDLAVLHPQIDDSAVNHQLHRDGFYRLGGLPYPGSALEHFIQQLEGASGPVLVDYPSLPLHYSDAPLLASLVAGGYQQALAGLLRTGGEVFGCFMINARQANFFQPNQFPLFQNVVEQLSVAVANILANEELAGQAQEKALQVAVTEALHRGNTWETRFEALARTLQQFVPFDYAAIGLNSDPARGQVSGFRRVGSDEYQVLSMESLARVVNLPPEKFDSLRQAAVRAVVPGQPHLLAGPDFVAQNRQHPFKALLARTFKLATNLEVPVPLRQGHFLISLYSQHAATYSAAHLQLLGSLTGVFTDTVEKLLAYEEVNRLNERLAIEKDYLEEELKTNHNFEEIIGTGPQIQQAFRQVSQVAPTDATVLLLGETGTGKELFARALHNASPRKHKVLVKVNCAALPAQLIESELFGHEKGAFTGAVERRLGKFELADGGTLFLDEVGELPLELQPKLLRALQEKEIERVGGQKPIHVDVRVVAATNRDLAQEVAAGRFRQDLYYRLLVFPITLPALRERPDDIPLLARHFLHKFGKRFGRQVRSIAPAALQQMQAYDWPGNVRELEHLIEQSIILSETSTLELARPLVRTRHAAPISSAEPEFKSWQDAERDNILAVLRFTGGRIRGKGGAAELLDIKANTLDSRMQKLSIGKEYTVSAPAE